MTFILSLQMMHKRFERPNRTIEADLVRAAHPRTQQSILLKSIDEQ